MCGDMSSDKAPYATLHDLPKYEKRGDVVSAPWMKDQAHIQSGRGTTNEPYVACNSQTAPFATFHNMPQAMEVGLALSLSHTHTHTHTLSLSHGVLQRLRQCSFKKYSHSLFTLPVSVSSYLLSWSLYPFRQLENVPLQYYLAISMCKRT